MIGSARNGAAHDCIEDAERHIIGEIGNAGISSCVVEVEYQCRRAGIHSCTAVKHYADITNCY